MGFPYSLSPTDVEKARAHSRWLWLGGNWPKAIYPLSWLIEKFDPPGWKQPITSENNDPVAGAVSLSPVLRKAIVYCTDNILDEKLMLACQKQLRIAAPGIPIVVVSLKPIDFGDVRIVMPLERGPLTLFKQLLAGFEAADADIIYYVDHDVLYHPSHFDILPSSPTLFTYNQNVWQVGLEKGNALYIACRSPSGLVAYRSLLIEHFRKRVALVEEHGFTRAMGFEPGTHNRPERVDDYWHERQDSVLPNIDVRHKNNFTQSRWKKEQFRNKPQAWIEAREVPGWGITEGRFSEVLDGILSL